MSNRTRAFALMLALTLLFAGCGGTLPAETEAPEASAEETIVPAAAEPASEKEAAEPLRTEPEAPEGSEATEETDRMIYAHVNGQVLKILAAENSSADAFLALLEAGDLTVEMHDYGGFEKVGPLGTALPRNDAEITTAPGDVILYRGDQITIYYDVNSWSFTRLGKVRDLSQAELKAVLGDGDAAVTFSRTAFPALSGDAAGLPG